MYLRESLVNNIETFEKDISDFDCDYKCEEPFAHDLNNIFIEIIYNYGFIDIIDINIINLIGYFGKYFEYSMSYQTLDSIDIINSIYRM